MTALCLVFTVESKALQTAYTGLDAYILSRQWIADTEGDMTSYKRSMDNIVKSINEGHNVWNLYNIYAFN